MSREEGPDPLGFVDFYALLAVPANAAGDDIERAWRVAAGRAHPDAGGDDGWFEQVTAARRVLCDPAARQLFDAERLLAVERARPTAATGPSRRQKWLLSKRRRSLRARVAQLLVGPDLWPAVRPGIKEEVMMTSEARARHDALHRQREAVAAMRREAYRARLAGRVDEAERLLARARTADRGR